MVIKEMVQCSKAKNKGQRYSCNWLLFSIIFYIRGPKSYKLVRDQGVLPLPCRSTILKYLKKLNAGFGFDTSFYELLKKQFTVLSEKFKNANHLIASFDEASVLPSLDVNLKNMTFDGLVNYNLSDEALSSSHDIVVKNKPFLLKANENQNVDSDQADHILVFMISSLTCSFNQPVGIFAAKGAT